MESGSFWILAGWPHGLRGFDCGRSLNSCPDRQPGKSDYNQAVSLYTIHNFGCRASAADGDAIADDLDAALQAARQASAPGEDEAGTQSSPHANPKVVIVNTCAVTAQAERSARAFIRRTHREHPGARILVTGCYAQRDPASLQSMPGVSAVIGNSHKHQTASIALQALGADQDSARTTPGFVPVSALLHTPFSQLPYASEHALPLSTGSRRTRPILKVQDGCSNRCSFCVIPETRGPSRSVPLADALAATHRFAANGGKELVLSGINLGRWGRDLGSLQLPDLVRALLEETSLPRLRISSVEPMDWSPALLALYARYATGGAPRLAPHAHLPLQSGADAVLRRMHRRYRPWHYAEKLQTIRAVLPEAAIGADVMVGFPGETEAEFEETQRFIESQPLTYLHLFPFSPRPRTTAQQLHAQAPVPPGQTRQHMHALEALSTQKQDAFRRTFLGKVLSAVTLRDGTAVTANFLSVQLGNSVAPNQLLPIHIASIQSGAVHGVAASTASSASFARRSAAPRAGQ